MYSSMSKSKPKTKVEAGGRYGQFRLRKPVDEDIVTKGQVLKKKESNVLTEANFLLSAIDKQETAKVKFNETTTSFVTVKPGKKGSTGVSPRMQNL